MAILVVESAVCGQELRGVVPEMPLAANGGRVAGNFKPLREHLLVERKAVLRPRVHDPDLKPLLHRERPVMNAARVGLRREGIELCAGTGEIVDVRGLDLFIRT